jgi:MoaA/NifB/PqqE/SkfB family radical SAM enzyme
MQSIAIKMFRAAPDLPTLILNLMQRKPIAFSFNVADRCPVGCSCYWRAQARVAELTDTQIVDFFHQMKDSGFVHVTLIGGEPYVRPKLLEKIVQIMPTNWLVTSGTTPLLHLPKTTHFISIDGKDAQTHDTVRGMIGLYERILKHLEVARSKGEFPVFIHSVLNVMNYEQIWDILSFWSKNGLVDGVLFSTLTPIEGARDSFLRLSPCQRIWIVDELLRAKQEFGAMLHMTASMIKRLHPEVTKLQNPFQCGTAQIIKSISANGEPIGQCVLSAKADCRQCGCVITTILDETIKRFPPSFEMIKYLAKLNTF